ncbi:hypothetical protein FFF34_007775 [Inquilinus sp. KBS0705]|nr:hypothetical protein FFF34_007775 [Inquilinus sp. KBS0705]
MERRLFIKLSAFTAAALTLPLAQGCSNGSMETAVAQPFLFSQIVDVKTINEAGLAYRANHISEDNKEILTQLLLGEHKGLGKEAIQTKLDKQVTADFRQGKTIVLKGWVMSITEARQCALYSIIKS